MIITKANIGMTARHEYQEKHQISERLEFRLAERTSVSEQVQTQEVTISRQALERGARLLTVESQKIDFEAKLDNRSRLNLQILMALYRAITGRDMQLIAPADILPEAAFNFPQAGPKTVELQVAPPQSVSTGSGLIYERLERYHETEKMQFQANGVVHTADGRTIDFSAYLSMSREYYEESSLIVRAGEGARIDPLVINFDGLGAQLSQTRFTFDLDSDGTPDQIAMLRPGSGMLALDRNGDGVINDGSELFGPTTGRGFAELARFDEDGNGFIDEGDSIYHKLRIWTINEDGSTQLAALGDKNIGAIFLGHVTTPFQLKDSHNQSLGEVVRSGIYLKESGQVGVVQEINLTV